ncbi:hypothetical protein [Mycolicibacterium mageritense]|uniref:hypothetical protein n=1 Tax=Mycolicibacterium mageritense TaxID=53462 RepID=UPI0011D5EFA0|nr:hypothetical protein [Mycolicibacterium mageritense]TXI55763.1 MAG: hypothetical protein E6Q55_30605 [Mycolicibacterium mageritense]
MGKSSQTRWDAVGMPWIAEALANSERQYQQQIDSRELAAQMKTHPTRPYMQRFADAIIDADLFWMSRTSASVAADLASRGMPEVTFQDLIVTSDLPPVGLMIWPKPLATLDWRNVDMQMAGEPIVKVTWDGIAWIYDQTHITTYLLSQMKEQRKAGQLSDMLPKYVPGRVIRFERHELTTVVGHGSGVLDIVSPLKDPELTAPPPTLMATVLSMLAIIGQQRVVTQKRLTTAPGKKSARTARNDVTMIDILRPPGVSGVTGHQDTDDRAYRRWFVRGHYRHQPYGPGNSLRKLIYISLHTAGHPDAPDPTGPPPPRVAGIYGRQFRRPGQHVSRQDTPQ